ncbi:MAG: hypothetical protein JWQ89_932 [Devosia sp.]|uniref:hypothetical protein n=1 Tax=Devosia sp. TaxID=1871048 RepID=UPI0026279E1C|nr:hypothetical protein [Devosia sp.]MDB5539205.1 hypothetical protein [Devosia sp.]
MHRFLILLASLLLVAPSAAQAQDWRTYQNETYNYAIEHPTAGFSISETDKGLTLIEADGRGQIDIYGAVNDMGVGPAQFEDTLAGADRIKEITYSRRGNSWLAISGYYRRENDAADDLIFYAKFMFSPDRTLLSAFEASYPLADKERFDPIIERMEDSLTAPRRSSVGAVQIE